jgi:diphthine-ammonia ligase
MTRPIAAVSWSGGKDSCTALHRTAGAFDVVAALTMFDEAGARSRSHGLTPAIVEAQADRLGVRSVTARCTWETYDDAFRSALERLAADGVTHMIFGDIMFDDNRAWAETMCASVGLTAVEPLWGQPTEAMLREFIDSGGQAMIVTARTPMLDESWLGRTLSLGMLDELARLGVDPCGERGEYHTLVVDSPLFRAPLRVMPRGRVLRSGCWALDVGLDTDAGSAAGHHAAGV